VVQVLVLLRPPAVGTEVESAFVSGTTRHEYRVMKVWEQEPEIFLNDLALLPFASLAAPTASQSLLERTASEVSKIESESLRREISSYAQLMAGLRFKPNLIHQVFREGMMRESAIYQEILEEGRQEGKRLGRQEGERLGRQEGERLGRQEGERQGRQEGELALILRQLTRCVGQVTPEAEARLRSLSLAQLDDLGEALLDFSQASDLENWLGMQS
jgi:predicted transposase YdaD